MTKRIPSLRLRNDFPSNPSRQRGDGDGDDSDSDKQRRRLRRRRVQKAAMDVSRRKKWVAWVAAITIFVVLMLVTPAIPQNEDYHDFADQRLLFLGIPNTLNVISNIPFFFVGVAGLILCHYKNYFRLNSQGELWSWTLFFAGVTAVAFGSSYYHLKPNDATLVWDRLPMTIAFTSIMAIFIIERVDERAGTKSLAPLVFAGALSIMFFDDLRPYAVIQFVPCIAIPVMAIVIPPMYTHSSYWLWAAGFYLLAKVEEAEDKPIYELTHQIVSGHTLKHLCAAMVPVFLALMLAKRTIEPERVSLFQQWKVKLVSVRESHRFNKDRNTVDYNYIAVSTTPEQ
uniref:Ceramidase n=1 Tax=Leersia perrieri TaxID=77586 RepID=A0A0D9VAM0_9ORYZ